MASILMSLCAAFLLQCAAMPSPAAADPPGWRLLWSDDFDRLDTERWRVVESYKPTNKSLHAYLPEQVSVADGKLRLLAEDRPAGDFAYRSGQVISRSEIKHGRVEVRAKLPATRGTWPAIWLVPDVSGNGWPAGGEIDIMENRGDSPTIVSSAFHYGSVDPFEHKFVYQEHKAFFNAWMIDFAKRHHVYAVDWSPEMLRFYVDGVHHYTVHDEDVDGFLSKNVEPMKIVINNAIGGKFLDDPDDSSIWPQTMEVDWVRVYEPTPDTFKANFTNGGFEDAGGRLTGWSVFGNDSATWANVSVTYETVATGFTSLKLYGPFRPGESYSGVQQGVTVSPGDRVRAELVSYVESHDTVKGTDNSVLLKIEFFDRFGAKYGGESMIEENSVIVADRDVTENRWIEHEIEATAPAGAVEARLSVVFCQPGMAGGAVHIDDVQLSISRN